jgi:hypothetical protein
MTNKFQVQIVMDQEQLHYMLTEEEYKSLIKEKLAHELAKEILKTTRATFTYVKNPTEDGIIVKATVIL